MIGMHTWRKWLPLLILGSAAVACSPTVAPGSGADGPGIPEKPKVDRVVLFLNPPPTESNDVRKTCCFDIGANRPQYENLIGLDPNSGKFVPQLAEEWRLEPDGKSYRLKLRPGVPFQRSLGDMTAKDVLWSYEYLTADPKQSHVFSSWWKTNVMPPKVVSDQEVVINLQRPNSQFMEYFTEHGGMLPIVSRVEYDRVGSLPDNPEQPWAGTGPWEFKERQIGSYVRYKRIDSKHWRSTPDFPEMELRWSKEASTRLAALLAGEAHITTLPDDLVVQAERAGMTTIQGSVPGTRSWGTWVCCNRDPEQKNGHVLKDSSSPLLDLRVRKALNKAIDRRELQQAFFGRGEAMRVNHMHASWPGWDANWERRWESEYGYDPAESRRLLQQAGYGSGKPLEITVAIRPSVVIPNAPDVAEAIGGYWQSVGVNVTYDQRETAAQTADIRAFKWSNHMYIDASATGQVFAWPNRNSDLTSYPSRGAAGYFDERSNALNQQLIAELNEAKQAPILRQIGEYMFANHGSVPLFFVPVEAVVNPQFVSGWSFPGPAWGTWTHTELIRAAR